MAVIAPVFARQNQIASELSGDVLIFPPDGSHTASPHTQISFRNVDSENVGTLRVTGSLTGRHTGVFVDHSDGFGTSYFPDGPFSPGESVTVEAAFPLSKKPDGALEFMVATPRALVTVEGDRETQDPDYDTQRFRSRPDLAPPEITVTDLEPGSSSGSIFVGVKTQDGQNGPMILDNAGQLVGFWPFENEVASINDVKVQEYLGQTVLTWWKGVSNKGEGFGHFVILDNTYEEIARVRAGNGLNGADLHEMQLTPQGTALILAYNRVKWDLSSIGGPKMGTVVDSIIQEVDMPTGSVLFEWHSLDHIDVDESYSPVPETSLEVLDYAHVNSIDPIDEETLIVSARNTHAIYKINKRSGEILWRLNGSKSDFAMGIGAGFAWQHDARLQPDGTLTLFDNHSSDDDSGEQSRGLALTLDEALGNATVVQQWEHPTGILSVSQGNRQSLPDGNVFIGWGSAPVFSEFAVDGRLVFNGRFPDFVNSYRAFRFSWVGLPTNPPALAVERRGNSSVTLFASSNGATEIASWRWLGGNSADQLTDLGVSERSGFETRSTLKTEATWFAAQAEDVNGQVLGVSEPVQIEG